MARLMPPQRVSFTQTAWNVAPTSSKFTTASVSWNAGDILVALYGNEDGNNQTCGTPAGTGLSFSVSQTVFGTASACGAAIAVATPTASGSATIATTIAGNAALHGGIGVWVIRGSDGVGNSASQNTATRTVGLTPTDAHSMILYGTFDFAGVATVAETPTATTAEKALRDTGHYTIYVDNLADQPSVASVNYGVGGSGTGPFAIVAIEIKGTLEKKLWTPNRPMSQAVQRAAFR